MENGGLKGCTGKSLYSGCVAGPCVFPAGGCSTDGPRDAPSGGERRARTQETGNSVNSVLLEDSPRPCLQTRVTESGTHSRGQARAPTSLSEAAAVSPPPAHTHQVRVRHSLINTDTESNWERTCSRPQSPHRGSPSQVSGQPAPSGGRPGPQRVRTPVPS